MAKKHTQPKTSRRGIGKFRVLGRSERERREPAPVSVSWVEPTPATHPEAPPEHVVYVPPGDPIPPKRGFEGISGVGHVRGKRWPTSGIGWPD
jgi:hypothetical protein